MHGNACGLLMVHVACHVWAFMMLALVGRGPE